MTDLALVRHGETVWHDENRYAGTTEVALSPRGHEQAEGLAAWARSAGLAAIWVSPLSRARATAAPAARVSGLELRVDRRLRELDFGRGEGLTLREMEERFPRELRQFRADPVAHHLPGGEDPREAAERVIACWYDIARAYPDGRVLIVMHTTAQRLALCRLIGVPLCEYRRVFPSVIHCAITEIRLEDGRASVLRFNAPTDPSANGGVAGR